MKKHVASLVLGVHFGVIAIPLAAHAQDKVVQRVQSPQDAWQVRRAQTWAIIKMIGDQDVNPAQHASALHDFEARLTAAEKGEFTPIEIMDLFRVFYVPKELQNQSPHFDTMLRIIATQATLV